MAAELKKSWHWGVVAEAPCQPSIVQQPDRNEQVLIPLYVGDNFTGSDRKGWWVLETGFVGITQQGYLKAIQYIAINVRGRRYTIRILSPVHPGVF